MTLHEAHKRLGEIHRQLGWLANGRAREGVELCDEAVHCITVISKGFEDMDPVDVAQMRHEQFQRTKA